MSADHKGQPVTSERPEGDDPFLAAVLRLNDVLIEAGAAESPLVMAHSLTGVLVAVAGSFPDLRAEIIELLQGRLDAMRQMGAQSALEVAAALQSQSEQFQALATMPLPVVGH